MQEGFPKLSKEILEITAENAESALKELKTKFQQDYIQILDALPPVENSKLDMGKLYDQYKEALEKIGEKDFVMMNNLAKIRKALGIKNDQHDSRDLVIEVLTDELTEKRKKVEQDLLKMENILGINLLDQRYPIK